MNGIRETRKADPTIDGTINAEKRWREGERVVLDADFLKSSFFYIGIHETSTNRVQSFRQNYLKPVIF